MKVEQSIPAVEQVSDHITDLSPEQQALLLRWLQSKRRKSEDRDKVSSSIPRAPRDGDIPLSFAQQRLWFLDQLAPGTAAYNVAQAARISGALDVASLHRAFNAVVRRHESLRTTFVVSEELPQQSIAAEAKVDLPVIDLSTLPEGEREKEIERRYMAAASEPFDLASGPLLRVRLLRISANDHVLLLVMHHIIADAWSMGILVGEIAELYEAYSLRRAPALAPLPIQYADYAVWHREWLSGELLKDQLSYWRSQLGDAPPVLELHTDYPRVAAQTYHSARATCVLDQELTEALRRLSRREGVTLFMTLLAVYATLLSRHSGRKDVVIGTPIAGRTRAETEGLIGVFINALALRVDLHGDPSFRELLQRVRKLTLDAYEHQALPFEKLVEELRPERDMRYPPLFQVALVLQNTPTTAPRLSNLELSTVEIDNQLTKYELTITAEETGRQLLITFEYARDLFAAETMSRLLAQWRELLAAVVAAPDARVSELPLMSAAEEAELAAWNATAGPYELNVCLHELVEQQVVQTPERIAVGYEGEELSYAELNHRANQLARYLRVRGVGPETKVGVLLERSVELVVGLLGILKAGGAYVPLDPQYPAERLRFMVIDSGATVLLTVGAALRGRPSAEDLTPLATGGHGVPPLQLVHLDSEWQQIAQESGENLASNVKPENLAYVIYTSGSTGQPKGVAIEHRNTVALLTWARAEFSEAELAGMLASTSVCFDLSVFEIFVPLSWGGTVILVQDLLHLAECSAAPEVKLVNTVPSVITEVLRAHGLPESVRTVSLAGEALPKRLVQELHERPTVDRVVNLYGPSEDTTYSTGAKMLRDSESRVLIGHPLDNRQSYILDERLRPVPVGATGELHLGGAGLARGYLGRPELTAEKFIPNPFSSMPGARLYKTGDIARHLPDGQIDYLGRRDSQVKLRGFRIELGEIEDALCKHENIRAAAVIAHENVAGEKQLVAYVVDVGRVESSPAELRNYLRERVPDHMIPSAVVKLDALPLTSNGKLDRRALPAPERDDLESRKSYVAPRNEVESELVKIWQDVIGVNPIGVADNFFEIGGHSLSAIRLMARVETHFGRKLPLSLLIHSGTIERMAEALTNELAPKASALVAIRPAGTKRPVFFIHPSGGGVLCYIDLAQHVGVDRPFYGLQDPMLDGGDQPYDSISAMAADYLKAVRVVQEEGPYLIGGYSFGGLVAFEMAQQMRLADQKIAALLILDSMSPVSAKQILELEAELGVDDSLILFQDAREQAQQMGREFNVSAEQLRHLTSEERLFFIFEEVKRARLLPEEFGLADVRRYLRMHRGRRVAIRNYVAQPYPDQITLFRTSLPPREPLRELAQLLDPLLLGRFHQTEVQLFQQPCYGWDKVSTQPIKIYQASGGHFTMLSEPHVRHLGRRLALFLDASE